jgi:uncharacterized protein (DUF362 family)
MTWGTYSRRNFLKTSALAGIAVSSLPYAARAGKPSQVSVIQGDDHPNNIFEALTLQKDSIKKAIGSRKVVLKPNNVSTTRQLAATHANALTGTLEFLHSIGVKDIVIAESAASGPTLEGFANYGYDRVAEKYGAQLVDLDTQPIEYHYVVSDEDFRPKKVRMSSMLLDKDEIFLISNAVLKTHDRVIATLSLKNIIFGAPIKDEGFGWGSNRKKGAVNDKPIAHGGGTRGINYNLFQLASKLHPDLAIIDGYTGMEGNGPVGGTPVDHKVCIVSQDWLAADRVGLELMGVNVDDVGWMNYCANAMMGESDISKMEILGAQIADCKKTYKLSDSFPKQLLWKEPMKIITG